MSCHDMYSGLLQAWPAPVCEPKQTYQFITERHLQAIWLEQRYFHELRTHIGESIEVVSPGIWNAEAGPDFCKAHLRIGGREVRGDIEIHLVDSGWCQHHHDQDPRYDRVVLHVSLWPPIRNSDLFTHSNFLIPRTYLEPSLTIPPKRILQLIDLDLYPYKKFVGSGRCAQSLFRSLPQEKVEHLFSSAAYWRLEQKNLFLEARIEDPQLRLPAGLAMALGYKANTEAFLGLFLWLQQFAHLSFEDLFARALGTSGFMDQPYTIRWHDSAVYRDLRLRWEDVASAYPQRFPIAVGQARPLNHPVRRLVSLCHLVSDPSQRTMYDRCWQEWHQRWPSCSGKKNFSLLRAELTSKLPSYQDPYWNSHYLFGSKPSSMPIALMGQELRQQVLVNTFLPLLYADITRRRDGDELRALQGFFASFRAPASGKQKYLVHRFFGETPKGQLLRQTRFEQGAFQIHRDFCVHYEASCEGCPFVDRVQDSIKH